MPDMLDARYRVIRLLGKGAMGEVFLAEHVTLGRRDALKVLRPDLNKDPKFASRLRREARAANRVHHPNIVNVFDFGQLPDGRYFLAMEYVDGPGLDAILSSSGPLPLPRVLRLWRQLADAADFAHRAGVVHRDLKPSNLIVVSHRSQPDFLKILDFGVAKIIDPGYEETGMLTAKGELLGTPAYMAPEQFRGSSPDPRWDIYSIGCIAYELLTGKPPFGGPLPEMVRCHLAVAPADPTTVRAEIPLGVRDLVLRCLEKDPARRPDGRELAEHIDRLIAPRRARVSTYDSDFGNEPTASRALVPIDEGEVKVIVRGTLRSALEAIVDSGTRDTRFVVGLSRIRQLEDELTRCQTQDAALCAQGDAVEQAARERIGSLRFALGELEFDQQRAKSHAPEVYADLGEQIAALERRLGEVEGERDRDLRVVDDQQISLAAARADAEEALEAAWAALEPALHEEIDRSGEGSTLGGYARQLSLIGRR